VSDELRDFLAANPDVDAVQLWITDPSGVARGKSVRRHELERLYAHGRPVAGSILGLDVTGADVDATGLVWDAGDADLVCRPVPGTLRRAPWLDRPTGQLMLSMYLPDGRPAPADPRHALARAIGRLDAMGLRPVLACELEFYLLRPGEGGAAPRPAGGERTAGIQAYSLARLDELAPVFDAVYAGADALGLPAETLMSEYAPGQFEITLAHRDDALRAVDEAIVFKRLLRGVAARHGLVATFMAKPFSELAGSGLHLHVSLAGERGLNLFADAAPEGSALCRHAIGGLRATMGELCTGGAQLGRQQPLGVAARAGRPTVLAPRRAPDLRRRRQPLRGGGRGARRRRAWDPPAARSRSGGRRQRLPRHRRT
jgi:glutamine synthetase